MFYEVDDMILLGDKPDSKCIFLYLTGIYNKLYLPRRNNISRENSFKAASSHNSENGEDAFSKEL